MNYAARNALELFRDGLCEDHMRCGTCVCNECPRDCTICRVVYGIAPRSTDCLYDNTKDHKRAYLGGPYRKDKDRRFV